MNEEALRQEIAELRQRIEEVDDWANGLHNVLSEVLPFLLRGHPEVDKVATLLRTSTERYDVLAARPELAEFPEELRTLEASRMLYRKLSILGVWPGVDPAEAVRQSLASYLADDVPAAPRAGASRSRGRTPPTGQK